MALMTSSVDIGENALSRVILLFILCLLQAVVYVWRIALSQKLNSLYYIFTVSVEN